MYSWKTALTRLNNMNTACYLYYAVCQHHPASEEILWDRLLALTVNLVHWRIQCTWTVHVHINQNVLQPHFKDMIWWLWINHLDPLRIRQWRRKIDLKIRWQRKILTSWNTGKWYCVWKNQVTVYMDVFISRSKYLTRHNMVE